MISKLWLNMLNETEDAIQETELISMRYKNAHSPDVSVCLHEQIYEGHGCKILQQKKK
jgi:hypothetical protein